VDYAASDLDTDKGAENVYRKLRKAARRVCGIDGGFLNLNEKTLAKKCVDDTLASAVRKLDRPTLTALHDGAKGKVG
jgi:UrcA family protein